jgi:hypothetical protein
MCCVCACVSVCVCVCVCVQNLGIFNNSLKVLRVVYEVCVCVCVFVCVRVTLT